MILFTISFFNKDTYRTASDTMGGTYSHQWNAGGMSLLPFWRKKIFHRYENNLFRQNITHRISVGSLLQRLLVQSLRDYPPLRWHRNPSLFKTLWRSSVNLITSKLWVKRWKRQCKSLKRWHGPLQIQGKFLFSNPTKQKDDILFIGFIYELKILDWGLGHPSVEI